METAKWPGRVVASVHKKRSVVAIVPARGGSKGLPGKNLMPLGGRPLLARAIDAARASAVIDRIVVSTDDADIARCARDEGAEVLQRPAELAQDETPTQEVLVHAAEALGLREDDLVVVLQPTSPLRTGDDVAAAVRLHLDEAPDCVVSVTEPHPHPLWMFREDEGGALVPFSGPPPPRRQDLPRAWALNGAVYVARAGRVRGVGLLSGRILPSPMPKERSVDIDDAVDLRVAEALLRPAA